jgi:uncharacterized membrane protein YphA (DoxX/SURF4 family)
VALRLAVGWHFFREGADKITGGDFTSASFMESSKGPFAPAFRAMIWDGDGLARLDEKATLDAWNQYREQVGRQYGFDKKQVAKAEQIYKNRGQQLKEFFEENAEDIRIYRKGLERRDLNRQDPAHTSVSSLRGQASQIERELSGKVGPWLDEIDAIRRGYIRDLNGLATKEQAARGPRIMKEPGRKLVDTVLIDQIIPTFDLIVGAFLMIGLFTRLTSLAGAGFLATIILTQWPWAPGALPVHYQVVEMFALLVLAAVGAGRFFGWDYFIRWLVRRLLPSFSRTVEIIV